MDLQSSAPRRPLRVVEAIEDYAAVHAHVHRYRDEPLVLAALHVDPAAWSVAHGWAQRMADAALVGDRALMEEFANAYAAALERLAPVELEGHASAAVEDPPARVAVAETGLSVLGLSNAAAAEPPIAALQRAESVAAAPPPATTHAASQIDLIETTLSIEVLRPPELVLPFVAPPTMSVDQYASMCASLEVYPDKRSVIFARYCIGNEAHLAAVHGAFRNMFAGDPAKAAAFEQHLDAVRLRLRPR